MGFFLRKSFRFKVIGAEYLNQFPEGTPVILCGNHRSHIDAFVLAGAVIPPLGKRRYLASIAPAKSMEESSLFRLTRKLGTFPLDRDNPELALSYFYETLKADLGIFIFPQGGRLARTPFHDYHSLTKEGRTGVARLLLRLNGKIPVVPFYIHGSAEALGVGQTFPRWGSYLSVTFGKPLYFKDYYREGGWSENAEFFNTARIIVDKIMNEIRELLEITEKDYFQLIEKLCQNKIKDIQLSEYQERKLRRITRKLAYLAPTEYDNYVK
jgi:1-acyl-sn-glycerol-3-phosphate acyltransferase